MARPEVLHGCLLLDATTPGWHNRVNIARLDLGSDRNCMLGQTHGFYCYGVLALTDTPVPTTLLGDLWILVRMLCPFSRLSRWAAAHGFLADGAKRDALTREWTAVILERRAMDAWQDADA